MKKIIIGLVVVFILFVVAILIIGRTFYPDNVAKTSADGGKKGLKTRIYKTELETAKNTVVETIPTLTSYGSNWKIVSETDVDKLVTVKAEIPVLMFTDDLEIKIKQTENVGEIQIDAISQSRVGKSDFGENARSVRKLLNALDEKLSKN